VSAPAKGIGEHSCALGSDSSGHFALVSVDLPQLNLDFALGPISERDCRELTPDSSFGGRRVLVLRGNDHIAQP
jgi:hypothetical protein